MEKFLEHLQILHEFSMAIGTSLDLHVMLRKSISTLLRKLNCQAGGVLQLQADTSGTLLLQHIFAIPREPLRINEYKSILDTFPASFNDDWYAEFSNTLPLHIATNTGKHVYTFNLTGFGLFILLKNDTTIDSTLVKSLAPLFAKLATACLACVQNRELRKHRDNLQALVTEKTSELLAQNSQLIREVLERKAYEKQLIESEERYAAVVEQAIEGIYLVDPDSKIVLDSNASFQRMLGYNEKEIQKLTVYDFTDHDRAEINDNIARVPTGEELFFGERRYRNKSGKIIHVEVSAKMIHFSGKKAILAITRDTTEKKQAQKEREKLKKQLRQAQKFEALGTLAGGVAHDLNNILSGVVGYPELLLNTLPEDSPLRQPLESIHDSGKRAATVVADLLTIARSAATKKDVYDLNTLIREYFASPEFQKIKKDYPDITHNLRLCQDTVSIFCSPVHIKKCLMNLVINATEAIVGEGSVTVTTSLSPSSGNDHSTDRHQQGMCVLMEVNDTGKGMDESDLEHIFEPFFTRKKQGRSGTGLGLTVIWNTVMEHNGSIRVHSSSSGTSFKLCFPLCSPCDVPDEKREEESYELKGKERILVIDDESIPRDIALQILQKLGYNAAAVSSGEEAIAYVSDHPVDLLVIDMLMEPGMNGRQTYMEIAKIHPGVKAIVASGFSENEEVKKTLHLGANGFIQKPFSIQQIGSAIRKALKE